MCVGLMEGSIIYNGGKNVWLYSLVCFGCYKRAVVFECVGSMKLSARCVGMHVTCTRCAE